MSRHPNVTHIDELDWAPFEQGRFAHRRKALGQATGGQKIGCSLYTVPAGKAAFPFHLHRRNEEAIYILAGEGTLRLGAERFPVRAGDYVSFPLNEDAHQLLNTSHADLTYLAISTLEYPEIGEYPDSNKLAVFTGRTAPDNPRPTLRRVFRNGDTVDYFEGE